MAEQHLILGGKVHAYKESWFATDHAAGVSAEIRLGTLCHLPPGSIH
jgi:hypothetical protein